MEDDFETVFLGDDVKNLTDKLDQQISNQTQQIDILKSENQKLKAENEQMRKELSEKSKQISQQITEILQIQIDRSKAIEENEMMKSYLKKQNLVDVIQLFAWRAGDEATSKILEQTKEIEQLKAQLNSLKLSDSHSNGQNNKPNHQQQPQLGIQQYKIFNDQTIEEYKEQIIKYEKIIKQQQDSYKEKFFLSETISYYLDSIGESKEKIEKVTAYIKYGVEQFQQIADSFSMELQIQIQSKKK